MTAQEIIDQVRFMMNFSKSQLNNDVGDTQLLFMANLAYKSFYIRCRTEASTEGNTAYQDITWPAAALTFAIPQVLQQREVVGLYWTNTDGTVGQRIDVQMENLNTWRWPYGAQPSAQVIRVFYRQVPETLGLNSTPQLFLPEHHEALCYELAIKLKEVQDQTVPGPWSARLDALEFYATKSIRLRIAKNIARIVPNDLSPVVWLG